MQNNEPSLTWMHQMDLEMSHSKSQEFEQDGWLIFASFLLKYNVTAAILHDNEKMKVQYLWSLLLDLFEIFAGCQNLAKYFRLISNFIAMPTKAKIISLSSNTMRLSQ